MPECAKTHLQQSRISKFSGRGPRTPLFKGRDGKGKGGEEREGKGKGRREWKDREGRGGTVREGGEEWGVVGRGGALDMGSAPYRQALDPPLVYVAMRFLP